MNELEELKALEQLDAAVSAGDEARELRALESLYGTKEGMEHKSPASVNLPIKEQADLAFRRLYGEEPQGRLGGRLFEPLLRGLGAVDQRDATLRWMQNRFPGIEASSVNVGGNTYYAGKLPGEDQLKYLNPPGFDVGDVAHMAGSIGPETVAGLMKAPAGKVGGLLFGGPGRRAGFAEGLQQLGQAAYDPQSADLGLSLIHI